MANNAGLLLIAGLGALLFLGRGGTPKKPDEERMAATGQAGAGATAATGQAGAGATAATGQAGAGAMPAPLPKFDIQTYIDALFGDTTTVPPKSPAQFFFPPNVVVSSSGVPGVSSLAPDIVVPTTKAGIDSPGDRTIAASSLAVIRTEQIANQQLAAGANVQPATWAATVEANRVEAMRQMVSAQRIMNASIARQEAVKNIAALRSRNAQEAAALAATNTQQAADYGYVEVFQPTINITDTSGEFSINRSVVAGQPIITQGPDMDEPGPQYYAQPARDMSPRYSESFVISGGMDSPGFASEDEQPQTVAAVHEITAAYDIGF